MNSSDNGNNSNDNSNNIGNDGGNDSGAAHAANISISVIVPAYNVQQFIDDCLHHIVEQMGPQHELIVVDDGSTDSTAARVEQVRAAHPQLRIVLQRQANQGISEARNAGLALARGDYIAFVDSDDRLLPGALAALDATIAARRPDVIATALRMWHPDAPRKDRDVFMSYPSGRLLTSLDEILVPFFDDRHMYIWCKVFRRAIYQQLAAPVFPPQRLFEDVSTVPLLLLRCRSLVYLPQVLLAYRKHPVSITRVISAQWCRDFVTALASVKPHLASAGVSERVQARFDAAVCDFYASTAKSSYELPAAAGKKVRAEIRAIFLSSLFGQPRQVFTRMAGQAGDAHAGRQARMAFDGDWLFHLRQSASRRLKQWRRMAHTRAVTRRAGPR